MSAAKQSFNVSLSALGAGDLIDRAVRFYRKFFWTFVMIAAPPVIVGAVVYLCWTILGREIFSLEANQFSVENISYYLFLRLGSGLIWLTEIIATLVVMGGASRNVVRHLLFGEAITFSETYQNMWQRLGGLVAASTMITVLVGSIGAAIVYFGTIVAVLLIMLVMAALAAVPFVGVILSVIIGIASAFGSVWLFFLAASRVAYVPQVMLVEGQGVFSAIGRSASLASGSVKRLAALVMFTIVAIYSALALLFVPIVWYASVNDVPLMSFDVDLIPAWYEIAYNLVWQISFILLSPVWMIGLCLLYVDERVRAEGYDIELMAAARLGDIPKVPDTYINPLHPALANAVSIATPTTSTQSHSGVTTLGLGKHE